MQVQEKVKVTPTSRSLLPQLSEGQAVKFQEIKGEEELEDKVNSPSHYNHGEIECIDAIFAALTPDELKGFVKGNVIKYLWRANHKEKEVEDLKKARWYLDYLINKLEERV